MEAADTGLVLITWQGWSVTGSITALLILLTTILLWLLPFPAVGIADQLANPSSRADLKGRFGGAGTFQRYLTEMGRLNGWLFRWFGKRWSGQAFERCVAIAFVFPVALFLLATVLAGLKGGQVSTGALLLFIFGAVMLAIATRAAFYLGYWFISRRWRSMGGDSELAEIVARIVLGAFAVVFAFAIAFAVASSLAGESSSVGTILFAILGGFAFALAFAIAFAFAGVLAFIIALVLVAGVALTMAKDFAFFLLLFFVLLPVLNALMDWLSWAITRFNVSLMEIVSPVISGALFVVLVLAIDIVFALIFVVALAILLPVGLELVDLLLSVFGRDSFDWRGAAAQAIQAPWDEGLFVTGMLLTPIIPTLGALTVGFAALVMPFTPGAAVLRATIPDDAETEVTLEQTRLISRTIYLSRLWYVPALALSLGLFLLIWVILDRMNVPVASFLYDLAMCSTAWRHGQCS